MAFTHKYFQIIDDDGNELPRGTEGNIALRVKPNWPVGLFKGYMRNGPNGPELDKDKNKSCFVGDFYNTGDRAFMDNDGYVFYVGRSDDVIISAGYRIGLCSYSFLKFYNFNFIFQVHLKLKVSCKLIQQLWKVLL